MSQKSFIENKVSEESKNRKSWKLEAMKNIIVLIEPQVETCYPHWKLANLYMNRFSIDEDAAIELLGVYYLRICSAELSSWNAARQQGWNKKEWNEARFQKGWNMNYLLNSHSKLFFRKVRFQNHKCCNC